MKKIISKLTAVILLICMIAGNIPTGVVYGAESGQTGSGQTTVSDESEGNAEPDGQTEAEDNSSVSQGDEAGEAQASENETPDVSEETQESKVENSAVQSEEKSRLQKNSRKKLIHTLKNRMIFITFILKAHISKHLGYSGSYFRLRMHLKTMKEYQLL